MKRSSSELLDASENAYEQNEEKRQKRDKDIERICKEVESSYEEKLAKVKADLLAAQEAEKKLKDEIERKKTEEAVKIVQEYNLPEYSGRLILVFSGLVKGNEYVFPADVEDELTNLIIGLINGEEKTPSELEDLGFPTETSKEAIEWMTNNLEYKRVDAIHYVHGRIKGYKGDETRFKLDDDCSPYIDYHGGAEFYVGCDWDQLFAGIQPKQEDIRYPDHKSTMAHAKIKIPVYLVSKKKL